MAQGISRGGYSGFSRPHYNNKNNNTNTNKQTNKQTNDKKQTNKQKGNGDGIGTKMPLSVTKETKEVIAWQTLFSEVPLIDVKSI